jgi:hypothetical protein
VEASVNSLVIELARSLRPSDAAAAEAEINAAIRDLALQRIGWLPPDDEAGTVAGPAPDPNEGPGNVDLKASTTGDDPARTVPPGAPDDSTRGTTKAAQRAGITAAVNDAFAARKAGPGSDITPVVATDGTAELFAKAAPANQPPVIDKTTESPRDLGHNLGGLAGP